jgi:hypothetical protein
MQIDPQKHYQLHRPKELADPAALVGIRKQLGDADYAKWLEARDRAGTAGPMIMVNGQVADAMTGAQVNELYTKALIGGANPCYVNETTGQVFMGHYVFVPSPEDD